MEVLDIQKTILSPGMITSKTYFGSSWKELSLRFIYIIELLDDSSAFETKSHWKFEVIDIIDASDKSEITGICLDCFNFNQSLRSAR